MIPRYPTHIGRLHRLDEAPNHPIALVANSRWYIPPEGEEMFWRRIYTNCYVTFVFLTANIEYATLQKRAPGYDETYFLFDRLNVLRNRSMASPEALFQAWLDHGFDHDPGPHPPQLRGSTVPQTRRRPSGSFSRGP